MHSADGIRFFQFRWTYDSNKGVRHCQLRKECYLTLVKMLDERKTSPFTIRSVLRDLDLEIHNRKLVSSWYSSLPAEDPAHADLPRHQQFMQILLVVRKALNGEL